MLEFLQAIHVLAGVFILAALALLLIFGFRGLCRPKAPRLTDRRADPGYVQLLRKIPH